MSCPFAQYSDIFGKPNTGFHSVRLFNIAVYDVIATILVSSLISLPISIIIL